MEIAARLIVVFILAAVGVACTLGVIWLIVRLGPWLLAFVFGVLLLTVTGNGVRAMWRRWG